jgi:cyclase
MRRGIVLGVLIGVGALSMIISAVQAPSQGSPSQQALDATKIEKVKDNLYVITDSSPTGSGSSGGNTAVLITEKGVVLVDTKMPGWGQALFDRIKTVTDKPVTTIINTHTHFDHTGSNEFFGTTVESIVQENTKTNMEKMDLFKGDKSKFLPKRTFKDTLSLMSGKDRVDLYYFGAGHTNGDTWVVFPALRVMHAGDMFAWKGAPLIDTRNGGSAVAYPETLSKAAAVQSIDTIITGHTTLMAPKDLQEYADFNKDFLAWAQAELKAGKTVDQAAAEYKIPDKYKGYIVMQQFGGIKPNVQAAYEELKR